MQFCEMCIPGLFSATLLVLACCAINCFSQTGCFVPVAGSVGRSTVDMIYTALQPGESPGKFYTTAIAYRLTCPAGASSLTTYASMVQDAIPSAGCWVDFKNDGSPTQYPNNYYQNGKVVTFNVGQCPIDDYIPLMFLGVAGMILFRRNCISMSFSRSTKLVANL